MKKIFKKDSGFTLIEILLGFLIFSIILVVLYSTFFSGMKIEERSAGDAATYNQAKMSLDMIGHELEEAVPFNFENFDPGLKAFEGSSLKISFLVKEKNGLRHVSYYLKERDKTKIRQTLIGQHYTKNVAATNITGEETQVLCLMRSDEAFVDFVSDAADSSVNEEVLFDNVRPDSFKISYAYLESENENAHLVWKNTWDKEYIPSGIRFEFALESFKKGDPLINIKKDVYIPTGFWGEAS